MAMRWKIGGIGRFFKQPTLRKGVLTGRRAQGLGERAFVEIVELAADRQAVGELGEADREALEPLGEIMGGGLALERRVHRQHDLVDAAGGDPGDQPVDAEILGPDAFERREAAAEDVEAAREQARAIERPEVRHLLDHAEQARVAARIGADARRDRSVSTLPQVAQTERFSFTCSSARSSGASAVSRFFIRCSTARRAERGPRPGSRASAWVSASISGEAMARGRYGGVSETGLPSLS